MTTFNTNKIAGVLISAAIGFSFVATTDVNAAPVFPPQHFSTQTDFNEANTASSTQVNGSWYRPTTTSERQEVMYSVDQQNNQFVSVESTNAPWYRSTN